MMKFSENMGLSESAHHFTFLIESACWIACKAGILCSTIFLTTSRGKMLYCHYISLFLKQKDNKLYAATLQTCSIWPFDFFPCNTQQTVMFSEAAKCATCFSRRMNTQTQQRKKSLRCHYSCMQYCYMRNASFLVCWLAKKRHISK